MLITSNSVAKAGPDRLAVASKAVAPAAAMLEPSLCSKLASCEQNCNLVSGPRAECVCSELAL